jgi:hypothetical protein
MLVQSQLFLHTNKSSNNYSGSTFVLVFHNLVSRFYDEKSNLMSFDINYKGKISQEFRYRFLKIFTSKNVMTHEHANIIIYYNYYNLSLEIDTTL